MLITIAGKLGSGKSTICQNLSKLYGFTVYSTGLIHRTLAKEMGITTIELNELMRNEHKYDKIIDDKVKIYSEEHKDDLVIFDSRLAWHFSSDSFKIYTIVDPVLAAKRVMASPRGVEERYASEEEAREKLLKRASLEIERFKAIYGVDISDFSNYNLIIDTSWLSPKELTDMVHDAYLRFEETRLMNDILLSPKSLYPTQHLLLPSPSSLLPPPGQPGYYKDNPVQILNFENYNYIVDGHEIFLSALAQNIPFVYAKLMDPEKYPQFKSKEGLVAALKATGQTILDECQALGNFSYNSIPSYYQ
jgi:cytidylate kinase